MNLLINVNTAITRPPGMLRAAKTMLFLFVLLFIYYLFLKYIIYLYYFSQKYIYFLIYNVILICFIICYHQAAGHAACCKDNVFFFMLL